MICWTNKRKDDAGELSFRRLSSGYIRISGKGPCNWAQVAAWPCGDNELDKGFFDHAGEGFRRTVRARRDKLKGATR